ncbi:MAG: hypothetical protein BGO36_12000 [Burkholderiales bacterium 68-10]|nr:MAG: hypothetical protein BGO36_12000 [Burkholderiales bacterium 68-10]
MHQANFAIGEIHRVLQFDQALAISPGAIKPETGDENTLIIDSLPIALVIIVVLSAGRALTDSVQQIVP